jgi:hypothetical protein
MMLLLAGLIIGCDTAEKGSVKYLHGQELILVDVNMNLKAVLNKTSVSAQHSQSEAEHD